MSRALAHRAVVEASGATITSATIPVAGVAPDGGSQRWGLAFADWQAAAARALALDRGGSVASEAWDAEGRAWFALIDMPAPHGPALLWKLESLMEVSGGGDGESAGWAGQVIAPVMADARRMLGGAA